MKKTLYLISTILLSAAVLSLSSCLKDPRFVDFSKVGTTVGFPLGGLNNFGADAITNSEDTIVRQFSVNIASPTVPTTESKVTLAIDNAIVTAYNASQSAVSYETMPTDAFVFTNANVTIPANKTFAIISVTFYKSKLDPSKSYMLPIKIVSGPAGSTISGNYGIHYFHFIGNDFAGAYLQDFIRTPAGGDFAGQPITLLPVTPTQFEVGSGYAGLNIRYEVSFTKTGSGAAARYSDFSIVMNPTDVANILVAGNGITLTVPATFVNYDSTHQYTYDEAVHGLFNFTWGVVNAAGAPRSIVDKFYKP